MWLFLLFRNFPSVKITEWWDDDNTAVCPYCGIDSIIGKVQDLESQKCFK